MINIWSFADYDGKIKIVTKDGNEYIGTICDIEDAEEDDDYTEDCLNMDCKDGVRGFFQSEIETIEKVF